MKEMCLLFPNHSAVNDAILILNPNYFPEQHLIPDYLKWLGYELIEER